MTDEPPTPAPTRSGPRLIWVTLGVALLVILIDQLTKAWALAVL